MDDVGLLSRRSCRELGHVDQIRNHALLLPRQIAARLALKLAGQVQYITPAKLSELFQMLLEVVELAL